eukprot:1153242-Pelagomonas_calceolata.AAC.2
MAVAGPERKPKVRGPCLLPLTACSSWQKKNAAMGSGRHPLCSFSKSNRSGPASSSIQRVAKGFAQTRKHLSA